jgi:hypothetical protein
MASCAQEKFLTPRALTIAFCVGALLLNASTWAAKPDSNTEWKPPKLPEAVTMKPDGAALNVYLSIETHDPKLNKQRHKSIQFSRTIGMKIDQTW